MQFGLLAKNLVVWQLGYISFCWHYILDVTHVLHFTSTSSGRDQFDLIASKGDNLIVSNVARVKWASHVILNLNSIAFSKMMRKLFRQGRIMTSTGPV